jgi:hypothetical protein
MISKNCYSVTGDCRFCRPLCCSVPGLFRCCVLLAADPHHGARPAALRAGYAPGRWLPQNPWPWPSRLPLTRSFRWENRCFAVHSVVQALPSWEWSAYRLLVGCTSLAVEFRSASTHSSVVNLSSLFSYHKREKMQARLAIIPLLQSEADLSYLRERSQKTRVEHQIMRDFPDWPTQLSHYRTLDFQAPKPDPLAFLGPRLAHYLPAKSN